MVSRLWLSLMGGFWIVMTALLWRTEYIDPDLDRTPVDADLVWKRVLTSPDPSSLAIVQGDRRLGFCHLITGVAESLDVAGTNNVPAGLVRDIMHYRLELSGSVVDPEELSNVRFDGQLTLTPNREWEQLELRIIARPALLTVTARREERQVRIRIDSPDTAFERLLRIDDMGHPGGLLADLFALGTPFALPTLPFTLPEPPPTDRLSALRWRAYTDRMRIGSASSQVYRLQLEAAEGIEIRILVSRAGEILRVDLPSNLTLVNEALTGL